MKTLKLLALLIVTATIFTSVPVPAFSQDNSPPAVTVDTAQAVDSVSIDTPAVTPATPFEFSIKWFTENLTIILPVLLGIFELLVRIFPTMKDWSVVNIIKRVIDIIPNNKSGGGTHT